MYFIFLREKLEGSNFWRLIRNVVGDNEEKHETLLYLTRTKLHVYMNLRLMIFIIIRKEQFYSSI